MLSKKLGELMFWCAMVIAIAGLIVFVTAAEGNATSPPPPESQGVFANEAQAEAYWQSSGYPACYPGGNGYYWDGYSYVWYPCEVY